MNVVFMGIHGKDKNLCFWKLLSYPLGGLDAVHSRHGNIHDNDIGFQFQGFFHGNLAVNRPTQYPAVLVECAFMILPEQEALLKTGKFRKKVAKGIARGIEHFLKEYNHGK